jgi:hypothetical protein
MKKLVLAAAIATAATGCYGSFGAFNKVHDWNGHVTGSKVGNSAIHTVFWILPVYEIVILGDLLIFNTVEFFSGSTPMK